MLRHKKEMKQHRLAEFYKKLKELMQRYYAMYEANPELNADKEFFRQREQEIDTLEKEYGIKPLKKQFNEEIKDYDPAYEAFCAAYGDDNY